MDSRFLVLTQNLCRSNENRNHSIRQALFNGDLSVESRTNHRRDSSGYFWRDARHISVYFACRIDLKHSLSYEIFALMEAIANSLVPVIMRMRKAVIRGNELEESLGRY